MSPHYKKNKFEKLRVFCNVVESGSNISYTAKKMNIDLASISKYISSLEKDLKNKLFDRKPRGLILTEYGKEYYEEAKIVVEKLNELYGGYDNRKIKKNLFQIYISKIKFSIIRLFKYMKNKLRFIVIKIKFQNLVILSLILSTSVCMFWVTHLKEEFQKRSFSINKSIAKSVEDIDNQLSHLLKNSLKVFVHRIQKNPSMNRGELFQLKDELGADILTVFDKDGFIDQKKTTWDVKKKFSIFGKHSCTDYKNMQYSSNYDTKILPIFASKYFRSKEPMKVAIVWDHITKQYLNISFDNDKISNLVSKYGCMYEDLSYISLTTPNGLVITDYGKTSSGYHDIFDYYQESPKLIDTKKSLSISTPFGGLQKEICLQKSLENTTKSGDYFYVLTTIFSKSQLNKKIKLTYFVFTTLTAILLFIIHAVHKRTDYVARRRKG